MRGNWTVTPVVNANRNQDMVHRAVGRPGVVLVGEGAPSRVSALLAAEKKRTARVAFDVPIFEFQVGNEEGQVPVKQLQRKIMRLPRNLKPAAISDLNYRLKALQPSYTQPPKGPLPRNARQPKMPRPRRSADRGPTSGRRSCRRRGRAGRAGRGRPAAAGPRRTAGPCARPPSRSRGGRRRSG